MRAVEAMTPIRVGWNVSMSEPTPGLPMSESIPAREATEVAVVGSTTRRGTEFLWIPQLAVSR